MQGPGQPTNGGRVAERTGARADGGAVAAPTNGANASGSAKGGAPSGAAPTTGRAAHTLRLSLALTKPVTWFAPMWAFLCGAAASGRLGEWPDAPVRTVLGMVMAGPVLLGFSQVINEYCDREVDAINEPHRPIPSGQVSTAQAIATGTVLLALGIVLAFSLGTLVAILVGAGLLLAVSYSVKPLRLKRNGWLGNGAVAFAYEGLPWMAGTAALSGGEVHFHSIILAVLYSIGAHGIMTVNDFKSTEGDRKMGIRSLPVLLGERNAAIYCCTIMDVVQVVVIVLAIVEGHTRVGGLLTLLLLGQWPLQILWIAQPREKAPWYNGTGILLFVIGMLVAALGVAAPAALR